VKRASGYLPRRRLALPELHYHLDPDSPSARHARKLALRLVAARIGAFPVPTVYEKELSAVVNEIDGDPETTACILLEFAELAWVLLLVARDEIGEVEEGEEEFDVQRLREQPVEALLAFVEKYLDKRGSKGRPR
jgi:hypothetical protein